MPPKWRTEMDEMDTRTALTAADLFVLLDREFRRRRPRECGACFVQLPYRIDTMHADRANWEVLIPPPCAVNCGTLMEEIVAEFQSRYDLRPD
jgi:hypothetical protein